MAEILAIPHQSIPMSSIASLHSMGMQHAANELEVVSLAARCRVWICTAAAKKSMEFLKEQEDEDNFDIFCRRRHPL